MTIYQEMQEEVRDLEPGDTCPFCVDRGVIRCPAHLVEFEIDEETGYAWCLCCDTAFEKAPKMQCPCEP